MVRRRILCLLAALPLLVAGPTLGLGGLGTWFTACVAREAERRHLFAWIPVCFGIGILVFFAAEGRPALWAPLLAAGLGLAAAVALRGRAVGMPIAIAVTALFAGFVAGVVYGGFMNLQQAKDPAIEASLGAALGATGDAQNAALKDLNAAITNDGWYLPVYEDFTYTGYNKAKVAEPGWAGANNYLVLSSITPAS